MSYYSIPKKAFAKGKRKASRPREKQSKLPKKRQLPLKIIKGYHPAKFVKASSITIKE